MSNYFKKKKNQRNKIMNYNNRYLNNNNNNKMIFKMKWINRKLNYKNRLNKSYLFESN